MAQSEESSYGSDFEDDDDAQPDAAADASADDERSALSAAPRAERQKAPRGNRAGSRRKLGEEAPRRTRRVPGRRRARRWRAEHV